jgi:EAL domain-containing protein (putative c-di-GMP-specific phosphodiesterase class I)
VQDLQVSADARAVVKAVVRLAHALNLSVVAEGVENAAQRDILLATGLRRAAGLTCSRGRSAAGDLMAWFSQRKAAAD